MDIKKTSDNTLLKTLTVENKITDEALILSSHNWELSVHGSGSNGYHDLTIYISGHQVFFASYDPEDRAEIKALNNLERGIKRALHDRCERIVVDVDETGAFVVDWGIDGTNNNGN